MAKERVERDDEDLVRLYLTDIGQYPLLTKDDEVRLAQAIEAGREADAELAPAPKELTPAQAPGAAAHRRCRASEAQQTFVQSNLRLVVSIAKKYQASGLPLLDLIQEGNLGLMHAVEKFDWRKGFKFSTYATWWIRQAITRGIANTGRTIRLPVHAGDTLARVQKAQARLELKLGRPATLAELGAEVEMPEDKLIEALRFRAEPLSLSEPLREDGDAELGDVVEDRSAESPFEVAATVAAARGDRPAALAARRARARDPPPALRPRPGRAAHPRGGRRALQPHPRADPPDRGPGDVEAPPPLVGHRRPRPAHRLSSGVRPAEQARSAPIGDADPPRLGPQSAICTRWRGRYGSGRREEAPRSSPSSSALGLVAAKRLRDSLSNAEHPATIRAGSLVLSGRRRELALAPAAGHRADGPTATPTATPPRRRRPAVAAVESSARGPVAQAHRLVNCTISHPRSRAELASTRSGLTTTGWPTASSIGRSVAESE